MIEYANARYFVAGFSEEYFDHVLAEVQVHLVDVADDVLTAERVVVVDEVLAAGLAEDHVVAVDVVTAERVVVDGVLAAGFAGDHVVAVDVLTAERVVAVDVLTAAE